MDCQNCGQPINEYDLYCPNCGANNLYAEVAAASRAAGVSISASEAVQEPAEEEDYYEDEYEQVVTKKSTLLPVFLSVGAAIILIAAIVILLLNTGDSDESRLGYTPPSGNLESNPSRMWEALPTLDLEPDATQSTEPPGFIWTVPTEQTRATQSPTTARPSSAAGSEVEIIVNTQETTTEPGGITTEPESGEGTGPGTGEGTGPGNGEGTGPGIGEDTGPQGSETGPSTGPTGIEDIVDEAIKLTINRIDADMFPDVRLYFDLRDEAGNSFKPTGLSTLAVTEMLGSNEQIVSSTTLKDHTKLIVLIDNSSLSSSNISSIKSALSNLAETMLPAGNVKNKLGIAMFTGSTPFVLPASFFCIDQASAKAQINSLQISAGGASRHALYDVLSNAVNQLQAQGYREHLLVYTGEGDLGSSQTKDGLISLVNSSGISLHFMSPVKNQDLSDIGSQINGSYIELQSSYSFGTALLSKYYSIKDALFLDYTSPFSNAGALNEIMVKLVYTDKPSGKSVDDSEAYSPHPPLLGEAVKSKLTAEQDLMVEHIDTGGYPAVRLYFSLSDAANNPVKPGYFSSFTLTEQLDGEARSVTTTNLKDKTEFVSLIDGNLQDINNENIGIVKSAFSNLAETMLGEGNSKNKLAVSMFSDANSFDLPLLQTVLSGADAQIDTLAVSQDASGARPLYDVLQKAITQLKAADYEGSILILAGGPDTGSKIDKDDLFSLIGSAGIPVHIITLSPCDDLRRIGLSSHGSYTDLLADAETMKKEHSDSLSDSEILSAVLRAKYLWEDLYIDYQSPFSETGAQDELTVKLVYANMTGVVLEAEYKYSIGQDS